MMVSLYIYIPTRVRLYIYGLDRLRVSFLMEFVEVSTQIRISEAVFIRALVGEMGVWAPLGTGEDMAEPKSETSCCNPRS